MSKIITITLNPAIDKTYKVDELVPEHKLRCANPLVEPGGGGINVSKGLKELGVSSLATFFAAGRNGDHFLEMLKDERLDCRPVMVEGETRESLVVIDDSSSKEFRIVVDGPTISMVSFRQILAIVEEEKPAWIIASGSLPKGLPENVYAELAKASKSIGSKFIIDSSGEPLRLALEEGVFLVKPNLKELTQLSGVASLSGEMAADAAKKLIAAGKAEIVVVSLSSEGAMLVTRDKHYRIATPKVEQRSTVGAGDSMVSGMVWALDNHKSFEEMLCWGVACGSAATMNTGTLLFKKSDAQTLFERIRESENI